MTNPNNVALVPTDDWLAAKQSRTFVGGVFMQSLNDVNYWYYPYNHYTHYVYTDTRPIRLKMSEIEYLRKAAKSSPKLKAMLEKFTGQIEIEVDFD